MYYSFHWNIKQHNFSTLSQYDKFLKHKIKMKMISEGSRDTEDWSNDAEHVPLPLQFAIMFHGGLTFFIFFAAWVVLCFILAFLFILNEQFVQWFHCDFLFFFR